MAVFMGSPSDLGHCEKIKKACEKFGIPCELRVTSAHKGPDETLRMKAEYEGNMFILLNIVGTKSPTHSPLYSFQQRGKSME